MTSAQSAVSFNYHEEDLTKWAQDCLKSILTQSIEFENGTCAFEEPKFEGSCWRAHKSEKKIVNYFDIGFASKWEWTPQDKGQNAFKVNGVVVVPGACLDDVSDRDFEVRVEVEPVDRDASQEALCRSVKSNVRARVFAVFEEFTEHFRNLETKQLSAADQGVVDSPQEIVPDVEGDETSDDDDAPTLSGAKPPQATNKTESHGKAVSRHTVPKTAVEMAAASIAHAKHQNSPSGAQAKGSLDENVANSHIYVRVRVDQEDIEDTTNARKKAPAQLKNEYELKVKLGDTVSQVITQVRASLVEQSFSDEYVEQCRPCTPSY